MKTTFLYKPLKKKIVLCTACRHYCKIPEGKTGICGVRKNIRGQLELLVFGRVAAANVDPVEKKPFYHFLPGSFAFSLGTFGCNFRCLNCQNFDISQILDHKGDVDYYSKINWSEKLSPEEVIQKAKATGSKSIAYTYNEPTVWTEYSLEIMKRAKKEGFHNVWVSNGFMTAETLDTILPYLDAINIDIKSFSDKFYRQNCGARVDPILENCRRIKEKKVHLEITTLIIPTLSDDAKMLKRLAKFIRQELGVETPWHISAFSGEISWKLQSVPETSVDQLKKIRQIGLEAGLYYVYAGNVLAEGLENTYCPKCAAAVIERSGYNIKNYLEKGRCRQCGYQILNSLI
ncbi:MAG: AmmeMemoRadiSam system radical SAM enzyme [Candidatus Moranbacteria bacterium CG06_land_8_20_14_3_00_40_12]|nr:MAG: AmmeMemoRadiSam system radical SAM enzyme [Candidatus Moranbacteria bacterium CG06_land_8_20_14_3_00_40_12]